MSPEQTRAVEVKAAADNAMLEGLTKIEEAAKGSSEPFIKGLKEYDGSDVEKESKLAFEAVEKNQTESLKKMLGAEKGRQEEAMKEMEAGAEYAAEVSSNHIRQTAEAWAENQAKNYIVLSANGTFGSAVETSYRTVAIRQEATELAKAAIKSAAQSLAVAQEAQLAIDKVPKAKMKKASKAAAGLKTEQKALNGDIELVESQAKRVAEVALESHNTALEVLREANVAEERSKKALETARGNSEKIAKLKERAQELNAKAQAAKK